MKKISFILSVLMLMNCREKYMPDIPQTETGYLVVEGFINSGAGATSIRLSRSVKLGDTAAIKRETKALVQVEAKNSGLLVSLTESTPGNYTYPQLNLLTSEQYRAVITTAAGKKYVSDYSAVRKTPDIDSVSWRRENGGVQIYANTHDVSNNTRYYLYTYDETWEFHSFAFSYLKFFPGNAVGFRDSVNGYPDTTIYRCWQSFSSYQVLLNTTEKLNQDIVTLYPVTYIQQGDLRLSVLYSIDLKQYALSREAFHFYEQLRKNTQLVGSIFDSQPSDNMGNMHALTDVNEPVLGFIEVTEEKAMRRFIDYFSVPNWNYKSDCSATIVRKDSVNDHLGEIPLAFVPGSSPFYTYISFSTLQCIDCRQKGVNKKPAFWP